LRDAAGSEPPDDRGALHARRSVVYSPVGSLILSYDFLIAAPAGVLAGALAAFNESVARQASTVMLATTAFLASLAGIVVAAHTIVAGLITPEYMLVLGEAGGIKKVSRPYQIVIWVCAVGVLVSLFGGLLWNVFATDNPWLLRGSRWVAFGSSIGLSLWALFGVVQIAGHAAWHLEMRSRLARTLRDVRAQKSEGGSRDRSP
jgi:hypothetical protein